MRTKPLSLVLAAAACATVHAQPTFEWLGVYPYTPPANAVSFRQFTTAHSASSDASVIVGDEIQQVLLQGQQFPQFTTRIAWRRTSAGYERVGASLLNGARGVSGDGSRIWGQRVSGGNHPARLSPAGTLDVTISPATLSGVSLGSVFQGDWPVSQSGNHVLLNWSVTNSQPPGLSSTATHWSVANGHVLIPPAIVGATIHSGTGLSRDGVVAAGSSGRLDFNTGVLEAMKAYRWTALQGTSVVEFPIEGRLVFGQGLSGDGNVLLAQVIEESGGPGEGWLWSQVGGWQAIGGTPTTDIQPTKASFDGSVVGGTYILAGQVFAFVWRSDLDLLPLETFLRQNGIDFAGETVSLFDVVSISDDGRTIIGMGSRGNPGLNFEPWRVTLPLPQPICSDIDINNDGSLFDIQDIDALLSVFSEGPCVPEAATCDGVDFNNDTSLFDPCDIDSFLLVFSEGPCTPCGL
jgi:hypothetical protein